MVGRVLASSSANGSDNKLHDNHASRAENENGATPNLLDHDECGGGRQHVDEGSDETGEEGIADGTELREEYGTKVEDEVDTGGGGLVLVQIQSRGRRMNVPSKLLHHLHAYSERCAARVGGGAGDAALEASCP